MSTRGIALGGFAMLYSGCPMAARPGWRHDKIVRPRLVAASIHAVAHHVHDGIAGESRLIEGEILRDLRSAESGKPVEIDCLSTEQIELDRAALAEATRRSASMDKEIVALGEASVLRIRARADADAIRIRAEAAAEAILLLAAAWARLAQSAQLWSPTAPAREVVLPSQPWTGQ